MIKTIYKKVLLSGIVAGMRSMAAPACTSVYLQNNEMKSNCFLVNNFKKKQTSAILKIIALGELIVDKIPLTPSRLKLPSLFVRIFSGAFCAYIVCKASKNRCKTEVFIGGFSALFSTFLFYNLRQFAGRKTRISDKILGLTEDLIVIAICCIVNRKTK